MSTNNPSYQSLIDRITAFRKSASDAASMPDSVQDKSNPSVPMDPEAKKKKLGMPADKGVAMHSRGETEGVDQSEAKPENLKNVASDNNNFDKVATNISNIAARAAALLQPQQPVYKQATADQGQVLDQAIELSPEFHFKLASAILETEEGINMAESILMRHKGQMEAQQLIKDAMVAHHEFVKVAAAQQEYAQYEEAIAAQQEALIAEAYQEEVVKSAAIQEIANNTTAEDQALIVKIASAHEAASEGMNEDESAAYGAGAGDAEEMMQHEEGESPEQEQGEEGPASMEELLHVLGMLVQSGEIDEQTAQQVAQELMAAEGGQGGGEEMAPEAAEGVEAAKSASALLAHFGA